MSNAFCFLDTKHTKLRRLRYCLKMCLRQDYKFSLHDITYLPAHWWVEVNVMSCQNARFLWQWIIVFRVGVRQILTMQIIVLYTAEYIYNIGFTNTLLRINCAYVVRYQDVRSFVLYLSYYSTFTCLCITVLFFISGTDNVVLNVRWT
jgi:hypothetical protein